MTYLNTDSFVYKKRIDDFLYVNHKAQINFRVSHMIPDKCEFDILSLFLCDQKLCMLRVLGRKFLGNFWYRCWLFLIAREVVAELDGAQSAPNLMSFVL